MLKRLVICFCLVLMVSNLYNCAKRGMPTGGPQDTIPPVYVKSTPENFSTRFKGEEIEIVFDEYVKLEDARQQVIMSPPLDPKPEISPMGTASKSINIKLNDTLQENTTYTINFGKSIVDNNEGNAYPYFKYVFSTGDYLDSLQLRGKVTNSLKREIESYIMVGLYKKDSTYTDSVVYQKPPLYIAYSKDSTYTFSLENMKAGTYQVVAIKDNNNNYTFEPKTDKIGFLADAIELPSDEPIDLKIFKQVLDTKVERPKQLSKYHYIFGYQGNVDSLQIDLLTAVSADFDYRIFKDAETDTLHYWFKPALEKDSLVFKVQDQRANYVDSLVLKPRAMEPDSLTLKPSTSSGIGFLDDFSIRGNMPLEKLDKTKVSLMDKDSLPISFSAKKVEQDNAVSFSFDKAEQQTYRLTLLPGAIEDFYGNTNDTLAYNLKTKAYADLSALNFTVQGVKQYPVLVQLITKNDEVYREQWHQQEDGNTFAFNYLKPDTYYVRVIYDENGNGKWDAGNFLKKVQPEPVFYYPKKFEMRANWDFTETFIVD